MYADGYYCIIDKTGLHFLGYIPNGVVGASTGNYTVEKANTFSSVDGRVRYFHSLVYVYDPVHPLPNMPLHP